jgi:AcrR family transcriptional regulator
MSMGQRLSLQSHGSQPVLRAALDLLAQCGYAGLSLQEIQARSRAAGFLSEQEDLEDVEDLDVLEDIVVIALAQVRLFPVPEPMGSLRGDLHALLSPWLGPRGPDERAVAAVLSASEWNPRLRTAVVEAFDRPLAQAVGTLLARATAEGHVPPGRVQTLTWILRSLALNRLRAIHPRSHVDLEELVDHLVVGLERAPRET